MHIELQVQLLDAELPAPAYAHPGDAGLDLYARTSITLAPFERALIPTGIALAIPTGFAGFIQPRSGLAIKRGLSFVNTPGLIDAGYRGEISVIAINLDPTVPLVIERGEKIAQLVIQPVATATVAAVDSLDATSRGSGGFGSTGL